MDSSRLQKWAELLLDTGKRNNLINFKDLKQTSAEVLFPDFVTLYNRADSAFAFEIYDPKLKNEEEEFYFLEEFSRKADEKVISKTDYLNAYKRKLKRQNILIYNRENTPISSVESIRKKAASAIEETGVNIAYLAIGWVHWSEPDDKSTVMRAPVLLMPITIAHESTLEPYTLTASRDEIVVNPTFRFKLQNDFGVNLPDFDDELGIKDYFYNLTELFAPFGWKVTTECKIGIFSFLKINLYNDLKDNAEHIIQNGNVCALLGEPTPTEEAPVLAESIELCNVVDADSSQSEAIKMALSGKSFVLQGPPGTGKSQTITNIIAECLMHGKTVLFVSEKLAALNVVYDKLKKSGLEEFCLQLHSHKASKKQVIDDLCHTLKAPKSALSTQAERELQQKHSAEARLNAYASELHAIHPTVNKSVYELINEASACIDAPDVGCIFDGLDEKGEQYFADATALLRRYADYVPSIGYDYRQNAWYGYANNEGSYRSAVRLQSDLSAVHTLCKPLRQIADALSTRYFICADSLTLARGFTSFFQLAAESNLLAPPLLVADTLQSVKADLVRMQALSERILQTKQQILQLYDEDVLSIPCKDALRKLKRKYNSFFARLFNGEYAKIIQKLRLYKTDGKKPNYETALSSYEQLCAYSQDLDEFNTLAKAVAQSVGRCNLSVTADFSAYLHECERLLPATTLPFGTLHTLTKDEWNAEKQFFAEAYAKYRAAFDACGLHADSLASAFRPTEFNVNTVTLSALQAKCLTCLDRMDMLDYWLAFSRILHDLNNLDLLRFVNASIDANVDAEQAVGSFVKAYTAQWIDRLIHDSPTLSELSRIPHDETVKTFQQKDELNFEINKAKIKANLSTLRPNAEMVAQGSSTAILLREGEKKRKQKPIRQLFSEIKELAQTLKPCFLMSPLSVSTYLTPDVCFDVVIFDEASQIFPQDAVGAIYRGKQLIVVGDSKQMPPSNFFNSEISLDDTETEDVTDFESVLDICATVLPQRRLKWHYRSQFEELIAFSNEHFYDRELVSFPSPIASVPDSGVDYLHVDGIFDRKTKTNRIEAEKIADLVFEHFTRYPERSLGVVAFSVSQQTLIDRLIARRRKADPSMEAFFRSDLAEPFFVKNLETVQGDERDTILFSTAYAKDADGKLLLNFGPINKEGGERRLNVAVTRAKCNVKLVTSLSYTDINLKNAKSLGAKLFRDYLHFAQFGSTLEDSNAPASAFETATTLMQTEICDFLHENGFETQTQLGRSSFKIDIAVKEKNRYLLAIECDGEDYRDAATARDRDRLRQDSLERMGWQFYRVWSTDWFRFKKVEKNRLLTALNAASCALPHRETEPECPITFEESLDSNACGFLKYEQLNESDVCKQHGNDVLAVTRAIVTTEAPLSEEWLLKRIVFLFSGREKVTSVVRDRFDQILRENPHSDIIRRDGFLYHKSQPIPMLRVPNGKNEPREIKHIALEELSNGILELVKQNVTVERLNLYRLLNAKLGFTRMNDSTVARFDDALRLLPEVIQSGEVLSTVSD